MDEEAMWKGFYQKIVQEREDKEKQQQEKTEHELRIQESDNGFFENLGTLLAERVRIQEQLEGPLPEKKSDEEGDEDSPVENESIEGATEALLETDSDRDEEEMVENFIVESMGWNMVHRSHEYTFLLRSPRIRGSLSRFQLTRNISDNSKQFHQLRLV